MADVTIVIVPRERFSATRESLESVYANTPEPFSLIYVDAGSPGPVRSYLERASRSRRFTLIRTHDFLSPNAARNRGLEPVQTEYVAFLDNDVLVSPQWLSHLVQCAEDTGAWVVGPLYCEHEFTEIHMAGGDLSTETRDGKLYLHERHRHPHLPLSDLGEPLRREPIDVVETHGFLARRSALDRIGRFDEGMLSTRDHIDFCLSIKQAGGTIFLEPKAAVNYLKPASLTWSDLPFFDTRWSERWATRSLEHFRLKWNAIIDAEQMDWVRAHRRTPVSPPRRLLRRLLGSRSESFEERILFPIERRFNRLLFGLGTARSRSA